MNVPEDSQLARRWVNWRAGKIQDPIWRLRYLRCAGLMPSRVACWQSRNAVGLLTVLALGSVVAASYLSLLGAAHAASPGLPALPAPQPIHRPAPSVAPFTEVWPVDKTSDFETYSNGLRVENQHAISHRPRAYAAFSIADPEGSSREERTDPAGIVYHTTESLQAPFESTHNNLLKQVGESLLDYVRRRRCYNFLVDRFGRVFRIVTESDAADHAGRSVWADDRYFYVDLNDSFIGIAFEAQTGAGATATLVGDAQIRSAGMLTEMLRSRYKIPGTNCVTHAQVSVNPSNMQIGFHTDWASGFPFQRLGLPDNYATPSPAVALFGFGFNTRALQRAGVRLAEEALEADRGLAARAEAAQMSRAAYRKALNRRYLKVAASNRR